MDSTIHRTIFRYYATIIWYQGIDAKEKRKRYCTNLCEFIFGGCCYKYGYLALVKLEALNANRKPHKMWGFFIKSARLLVYLAALTLSKINEIIKNTRAPDTAIKREELTLLLKAK